MTTLDVPPIIREEALPHQRDHWFLNNPTIHRALMLAEMHLCTRVMLSVERCDEGSMRDE